MTNFNKPQISAIISKITFLDGSSVQERASDIVIKNNNLGFSLDITGLEPLHAEEVRNTTIQQLQDIKDIEKISIVLTSNRQASTPSKTEKAKLHIEGVAQVILVAAGKGGVGKSTISALLAHKLTTEGKKVGIIDADIYGPSIPHMFGLQGKPALENDRMIPLQNYNILVNSIGFLTAPSASISWRGPMTSKALYQLLSLTNWGNLDYLIIDTPPGTGDIHLSLLQNYIIDQVLMVTTPQKISELDVSRAIGLYNKFNIPIIGIIENMSYYIEPKSKQAIQLFSGQSGEIIAKKYNIPLLAKLPINPDLSYACDTGQDLSNYTNLLNGVIVN
ncbi:MAG: P-loop NTPase [Rickettsiaceae bacterium]|nr:P-loop NTPase [Rickettsiaceae bacterium]MDP4832924.1 P-loop NTPase [Rickettsiaceae bacterium]MDP5020741.1 P-loop NTPase [Rickettsiaceae bacterium]MDP5083464.1 P-loop NTPase [Rickettsiaceae bacterium]